MHDDLEHDREALRRLFRHPIPRSGPRRATGEKAGRRLEGSKTAALIVLAVIVGGAFLTAPEVPRLRLETFLPPVVPVTEVPTGTPVRVVADLARDGYAGLFVLDPRRRRLEWLYPKRSAEVYRHHPAGRSAFRLSRPFRPRGPGEWLLVHVLSEKPITAAVKARIVERLSRSGLPLEATPLRRALQTHFPKVLVRTLVCSRY